MIRDRTGQSWRFDWDDACGVLLVVGPPTRHVEPPWPFAAAGEERPGPRRFALHPCVAVDDPTGNAEWYFYSSSGGPSAAEYEDEPWEADPAMGRIA